MCVGWWWGTKNTLGKGKQRSAWMQTDVKGVRRCLFRVCWHSRPSNVPPLPMQSLLPPGRGRGPGGGCLVVTDPKLPSLGPRHLCGPNKTHGSERSGDATSETSVFISSCLTSPRGTIKKGSNLIKVMQQSAGEHVSPGCCAVAFPLTLTATFPLAAVSSGTPEVPMSLLVAHSPDDVSPSPM